MSWEVCIGILAPSAAHGTILDSRRPLVMVLLVALHTLAGEGGQVPDHSGQPQDACRSLMRQSANACSKSLMFA